MRDSAVRVNTMSLSATRDVVADSAAQHHPLVVLDAPGERGFERREQLRAGDLGEKAQRAEVDAEDRHVASRAADDVGHREQRAVAAEHEHQIGALRRSSSRVDDVALGRRGMQLRGFVRPDRVDALLAAASASSATSVSRAAARLGLVTMPTRIDFAQAVDFAWRRQMHQELAVAFGAGDRRVDHGHARQSYFSGRGGHLVDHARVDRRVAARGRPCRRPRGRPRTAA